MCPEHLAAVFRALCLYTMSSSGNASTAAKGKPPDGSDLQLRHVSACCHSQKYELQLVQGQYVGMGSEGDTLDVAALRKSALFLTLCQSACCRSRSMGTYDWDFANRKGAEGVLLDGAALRGMEAFLSAAAPRVRVLGGTRFDAAAAAAPEWAAFGSYCFLLPRLELLEASGCCLLCCTLAWRESVNASERYAKLSFQCGNFLIVCWDLMASGNPLHG